MAEKELEQFQESIGAADAKMDLLMDMEPSRLEMVKGKRDFLKQTIILSAGIIAFAIPILDKGGIIKHPCIYNISLIGFIAAIILGMIYRYWLNKQEQDTYKNFMSFFTGLELDSDINSIMNKTLDGLLDIKGKLPNPIKFYKYEKWIQLGLILIFIVSLTLLVISVIS